MADSAATERFPTYVTPDRKDDISGKADRAVGEDRILEAKRLEPRIPSERTVVFNP
jgi:hypothetical protein